VGEGGLESRGYCDSYGAAIVADGWK